MQGIAGCMHIQKGYQHEPAPLLLIPSVGCDLLQVFGVIWNKGDLCVDRLCGPVALFDRPGGVHFKKVACMLAALISTIKDLHELYYSRPKSE